MNASSLYQVAQDSASASPASTTPPATETGTLSDAGSLLRSADSTRVGELIAEGRLGDFSQRVLDGLSRAAAELIPDLIGALVVFGVLYLVYRILGAFLIRLLRRSKRVDAGLESLISKTYRILAYLLIALMVLGQFGVNITALLAGLSIVGVAVGFAAKDTVENFISGLTILLDKPFALGDVIEVDGTYGIVEDLTLRSTRVRTVNRQVMVLPNLQMVNQKVINFSMLGVVRVDVDFGIAYKEYPEEARRTVLRLTEEDDRLHPEFPAAVVVTALNDSSVDIQLRLYLKDASRENEIRADYTEQIREALRAADIEIPYPHLQLFVDGATALERSRLFVPPGDNT
jgi:small conductance mechanosensitive channel